MGQLSGDEAEREIASAHAAYQRALAAYESARERDSRVAEFAAAAEVDRTRRIYFAARAALGVHPEALMPATPHRGARRYRPFIAPARNGTPGGWMHVALNVALPVVLFAGLAIPIGIFAMSEAARPSTLASDVLGPGKAGGTIARAPTLSFARPSGERAAPRFLDLAFTSDIPLSHVTVLVNPDPGIPCEAVLDGATQGRARCSGTLPGGREFSARITATGVFGGAVAATYEFRTREQVTRLTNVKWFTEFEDPRADPLACAAASARIIQNYTTGRDVQTAYGILAMGRPLNRSRDPGLDPAAIAEVLHRLEPTNNYHYYIYSTREEMTRAAAAWLMRSGKPVVAITLGGQHAPLIVGFTGEFGASVDDPATRITGVVVMDPQRGDLDPRTAHHRPDKARSLDYQTGHELTLTEWYRDEWWLGSPYWFSDRGVPMDRNDGAYPLPHWSGNFVLIADDGDSSNPPNRMGRVPLR
ncbi:MAG: hypothetical protein FJ034_06940 [Chloroflexi bacterium]|nr:hypothetical protein [Chloroflexota bacterium]